MILRYVTRGAFLLLLLAFGLRYCVHWMAYAHGAAHWIQVGGYTDREGIHCCGVNDCEPVPCAMLIEDERSIEFEGQKLLRGLKGIYWSAEPNPADGSQTCWACKRGGVLKCLFRPQQGS